VQFLTATLVKRQSQVQRREKTLAGDLGQKFAQLDPRYLDFRHVPRTKNKTAGVERAGQPKQLDRDDVAMGFLAVKIILGNNKEGLTRKELSLKVDLWGSRN